MPEADQYVNTKLSHIIKNIIKDLSNVLQALDIQQPVNNALHEDYTMRDFYEHADEVIYLQCRIVAADIEASKYE
jgi:hypothetical protein